MPGWKSAVGRRVDEIDIHENEEIDDAQLGAWVKQASEILGDDL